MTRVAPPPLIVVLSLACAAATEPFAPYHVFVAQDAAHARCGPGQDYYQTDPLRFGQDLNVYAETDDGWLGVQPPGDSFDWLPADAIDLDPGGKTGRINEDQTVCWIGTHLGRAKKYRWQVRLGADETVAILGRAERPGPDGPQLWYRVVPPPGEFRWVHRDDVVDSGEALAAVATANAESVRIDRGGKTYLSDDDLAGRDVSARDGIDRRRRDAVGRKDHRVAERDIEPEFGASVLESVAATEPAPSAPTPMALAPAEQTPAEPVPMPEPAEPIGTPDAVAVDVTAPRGLMAYLGKARIRRAGQTPVTTAAPRQDGWVAKNDLPVGDPIVAPEVAPSVMLAGVSPLPVRQLGTSAVAPAASTTARTSSPPPTPAPAPVAVSRSTLDEIRRRVAGAEPAAVNLVLSELMGREASSVEVRTLIEAANANPDPTGSMADVIGRGHRYVAVASRREGVPPTIVESTPAVATVPVAAAPPAVAVDAFSAGTAPPPVVRPASAVIPQDTATTLTGQLVRVYSARPGSPPYALVDAAGTTVSYVTPIPGMNLTVHVNSNVEVAGHSHPLTGLTTPNLRAESVLRR